MPRLTEGVPQLDDYSLRFAEQLFAQFPQWREFASIKGDGEGILLLKVPAPKAMREREEDALWMDTDGEITVSFDAYHTHFGLSQNEELARAVKFIKDLVEEKICVVSLWRNNEWRGSTDIESGQEPNVSGFSHFDTIRIRSWQGTHDKVEKRVWKPDTFAPQQLHRVLELVREPVTKATAAKVATERQLKELRTTIEEDAAFAFFLLCNHISDSGCVLPVEAYDLLESVGEHLLKSPAPSNFRVNQAMWESLMPQVEVQNA